MLGLGADRCALQPHWRNPQMNNRDEQTAVPSRACLSGSRAADPGGTPCSAGSRQQRADWNSGDSILSLVIADDLFHHFPQAAEVISAMRYPGAGEDLGRTRPGVPDLGDHLILGPGELKSGGFRRESIPGRHRSEAVIGAVYLDTDLERCGPCCLAGTPSRLDEIRPGIEQKDPKGRLQEILQGSRKIPADLHSDQRQGEATTRVHRPV